MLVFAIISIFKSAASRLPKYKRAAMLARHIIIGKMRPSARSCLSCHQAWAPDMTPQSEPIIGDDDDISGTSSTLLADKMHFAQCASRPSALAIYQNGGARHNATAFGKMSAPESAWHASSMRGNISRGRNNAEEATSIKDALSFHLEHPMAYEAAIPVMASALHEAFPDRYGFGRK